jgi:hypothetical protein
MCLYPSTQNFPQSVEQKASIVRSESPLAFHRPWELCSVIVSAVLMRLEAIEIEIRGYRRGINIARVYSRRLKA